MKIVRTFAKSSQFIAFGFKSLGLACVLSLLVSACFAEEQEKPKAKHRNTPLDTIMQSHLRADVPEPKAFVKEHRPAAKTLDYRPVTGTDPERPKLKTPAELKDLETQLEAARISADKKAGLKPSPAAAVSKAKPAAGQ